MPATIAQHDIVTIRAEVTRVSEDGKDITIRLPGFGYPVTIKASNVESVEKIKSLRSRDGD
jgi:hypothetical protein